MRPDTASRRYRERHIEQTLPTLDGYQLSWKSVLVIPAYREGPAFLALLQGLAGFSEEFLAIIVVNRPDSDGDAAANRPLLEAIRALPEWHHGNDLYALGNGSALLLEDTEAKRGLLPSDQGVGMARKIGCDIAWLLIDRGLIDRPWIHCSDADARLPRDYFRRAGALAANTAAATYPFTHVAGNNEDCNDATALYELRLHHYVLGLEFAGSPYAYHTLGSCLAVNADAYARVRGVPKRAAGEDFYLLNKLAKVGEIARLSGDCIELESRESHRVPFGTGPAVAKISRGEASEAQFYHPVCFLALRAVLKVAGAVSGNPRLALRDGLEATGLEPELASHCCAALSALGWQSAIEHCRQQSQGEAQFLRQFHQWFDGFRTLKFIHAMRDLCLPSQTLSELERLQPMLWPDRIANEPLAEGIRRHWGWTRQDPARW